MDIFLLFLKDVKIYPVSACFAVAGPVQNRRVIFTNLNDWVIDADEVSRTLGIRKVSLVNDFVAVGYGLLTLNEEKECIQLQGGNKDLSAPIAAVGAGTGLGECFLTPDKNGLYSCFPSEGGHAEFAPRNDLEFSLLLFLKTKFKSQHRVSVERVVSGHGLANIYEFLCIAMPDKVDPAIHVEIDNATEKGAVIAKYKESNEICQQVMDIFVTSYGAEAGVAGLSQNGT